MCHGLFDRFPRIRVASIEAGASWVPALIKKLAKAYGQMPSSFASDPVETFRAHVWVAPFYEDDMGSLKDDLGLEHLLFGSDWPHAEGLADPRSFAEDLRRHDYSDARDLHGHGGERLAPHPAPLTSDGLRRHPRGGGLPGRGPGLARRPRRRAGPRPRPVRCAPT